MSKARISFGGHTKTHYYLGVVKDEKMAFEEIAGSKKRIEEETGLAADYFCYPSGGFSQRIKELVIQAGYKGACTTNRGFADFNSDVYELKRIKVTNSDAVKPFSFWVKLSGYYNILRREKSPY
jgi:peptidoglycan/xylan/chitin deacetylase (PgdA/CDA1 family)